MLRVNTLENKTRMSTQELLQKIGAAVEAGETDFHIAASGQHDIGGPLWNRDGLPLRFSVTNPGQRVGSMCMPGTSVRVEGSAPADVGWLNSGGEVIVTGDAGDTAGHCAAGGKIYIGGRAGTRSGSLMKRDPLAEEPELWILKSTGSFSFEFMGGGRAAVCGYESQTLPSVLGERPCVGMVGGVVYFRGPVGEPPEDVALLDLDAEDILWLERGMDAFLENIGKSKLKRELTFWKQWRKLVPATKKSGRERPSVRQFREESWFAQGLFGDALPDDFQTAPLVAAGSGRMRKPARTDAKCVDCRACLLACPRGAMRRRGDGEPIYEVNEERCVGCLFCVAVCPEKVWRAEEA